MSGTNNSAPTNSGGFQPYDAPQDTLDQLEQFQGAKFPTPAKLAGPSCSTCGDNRAVVDGTLPDGRDRLVTCPACFGVGPEAEEPIECMVHGCDQPATVTIEFASSGERPYCDACAAWAQLQIAFPQRPPTPIFGEVIRGTDDAQWDRIPALTRGDLLRYIKQRIEPGGFLKAFLEADIDAARAVASVANERALPALAYWVYIYAPRESFGSANAVAAWLGSQATNDTEGLPMDKRTDFCTQGHQPLDYDDFRANCSNVSAWPWGPGRMHLGECNTCGSSISYPPPAELARAEDYQGPGSGPRIDAPLPTPSIFWDESRQVYGYRDGDEEGVCKHASTTDVLDLLGDDEPPALEQLHGLGDDWGFRTIDFVDRRGRSHRLLAESYRMAEHYEPYDGLNAESRGELARITEFSRSSVVGTGA